MSLCMLKGTPSVLRYVDEDVAFTYDEVIVGRVPAGVVATFSSLAELPLARSHVPMPFRSTQNGIL